MTTCGHIPKTKVKSCKIHVRITKRGVTILMFPTCYVFESREIKVGYSIKNNANDNNNNNVEFLALPK